MRQKLLIKNNDFHFLSQRVKKYLDSQNRTKRETTNSHLHSVNGMQCNCPPGKKHLLLNYIIIISAMKSFNQKHHKSYEIKSYAMKDPETKCPAIKNQYNNDDQKSVYR